MTVCAVPEVEQIGIVNACAVGSQWDLLATRGGLPPGHDALAPGPVPEQCGTRRALDAEEKCIYNAYSPVLVTTDSDVQRASNLQTENQTQGRLSVSSPQGDNLSQEGSTVSERSQKPGGVVAGSSGIFEGSIRRIAEGVKGKTHDPQTDVYRYGGSH